MDTQTGARLQYGRIDGHTTLEDREKAIQEFNRKGSGGAGRGSGPQ